MSQQQVQRLQTLLETVQRNRQRPGEPIGGLLGGATNVAAANIVQGKSPANTTKAAEPARARVATPEVVAAPPARPAAAKPAAPAPTTQPKVGAPAQAPAAAQAPTTQPKVGAPPAQAPATQPKAGAPAPRAPEPQPAVQEPIVPRTFEPEVPRAATRPIAQLVSKHAPVVDATFGAMLKRSLSLRPH